MATYEIYTLLQLQDMSSHLEDECVLMNDIDASDTEDWNPSGGEFLGFIPVGDSINPFNGSFNGNNFTISNLYCNRTGTSEIAGLFGFIRKNVSYEKVTNGTFTGSATGWTLGVNWTYGINNVVKSAGAGSGTLSQDCSVVVGETYILKYVVSSYVAGTVTPSCGGATLTARSANGTYTEEFTATTTDVLTFTPTDNGNFRLDTISLIRKITFKDVFLKDVDITGYDAGPFATNIIGTSTVDYTVFDNIQISGTVSGEYDVGGFAANAGTFTMTDCEIDEVIYHTESDDARDCGGFFASIGQSAISGCTSNGVIVCSGDFSGSAVVSKSVGGFIGIITTSSTSGTITSCKSNMGILVTTNSSGTNTWTAIAGFVGYCAGSATMTLCGATGSITYTGNIGTTIGGFIGSHVGAACSKCYATGDINAPNVITGTFRAGGFGAAVTSDCYAWGNVCKNGIAGGTATINLGGFVGQTGSNITDSYSTGYVYPIGIYGGFIGVRSAGTMTTCYWDTDRSGLSNAVGTGLSNGITGKTTAEMILAATYVGFNFTTIWVEGVAVTAATLGSNITIWLSKSGDYDAFEAGVNDDDSFSFEVPTQDEIRWLGALESLLLGTAGGEWKIGSNKLDTPLTPTNFTIKQQTDYGSNQVQPIKVNSSLLYVDYVSRKVREMTFVSEKYEAPDLTALAEHITKNKITSFARQKNPDSVLWFTTSTGELLSMTYEREQNVLAWSKHIIGGNPFVQCVCVLPGIPEDTIYLSCYRNLEGDIVYYDDEEVLYGTETVRDGIGEVVYIEKMAPRDYGDIEDAYFLDCGLTVTNSPAASTASGLSHIDGETVSVLADGVVMDDAVVEDGQISITKDGVAVEAETVQVGLKFTYLVQPMRIVLGSSSGSSMGSVTRVNELVASFADTLGVSYGNSSASLYDIDFSDNRWENSSDKAGLFTGEVTLSMPGGFSVLNPIFISGDSPLPCILRCLIVRIDKTGR